MGVSYLSLVPHLRLVNYYFLCLRSGVMIRMLVLRDQYPVSSIFMILHNLDIVLHLRLVRRYFTWCLVFLHGIMVNTLVSRNSLCFSREFDSHWKLRNLDFMLHLRFVKHYFICVLFPSMWCNSSQAWLVSSFLTLCVCGFFFILDLVTHLHPYFTYLLSNMLASLSHSDIHDWDVSLMFPVCYLF